MGVHQRWSNKYMRDALSDLAGADYYLAAAAQKFEDAREVELQAEAQQLFEQALAFRRKVEKEIGDV
jgi:hypothetical protein